MSNRRQEPAECRRLACAWRVKALAGLMLLAPMWGCDLNKEHDGTRVAFWAMGREGEAVQAMLPEFRRRYPDIEISVQQIPWNAAHEKLLTAYVGGHLPDVFQLGNTWIPEFVAIAALEDLSRRFQGSLPEADFFSGILETNRLDEAIYGVPWYVDTRLLFYRTDLLQQAGFNGPPRTWPHWWAALRRLKADAGAGQHAILLPVNEWQPPVILALQLGATLLRDGGRYGDFQSAAFREAFSRYLEIYQNGWAPAVGDAQLGNLYHEFGRGLFAFYVTGPWNLGEFRRRLPAELAGRWTTAPLPAPGPTADYPGVSIAGGASLVLAKESRNKEAAWKLIEFLAEPAQQLEFYRQTGDLPPRKTTWEAAELAADAEAQAFRIQLEHVLPLPKIPEWERIAAKISHYAERAIRGELTADGALQSLDRDVDAILEKRRWLLERAPD
jgi:multiple sugar transport system substrate-binding protein